MLQLKSFSYLGCPQEIKTNNSLGYITQATQVFLEKSGIWHKTGIPYNPSGQSITEKAHQTFKILLNKQKRGSQETLSRNLAMLAKYSYNFLNCGSYLKSPVDNHLVQHKPAGPHPLVLYKDLLGERI